MHIGIDLGGTKTESIIIDENGKEIERLRKDTPKNYNGTFSPMPLSEMYPFANKPISNTNN